jgi:hypothetical protein
VRAADSVFAHSRSGMEMAGEVRRPGLSPGIYFRLLMVGYVEGIDSDSHIFPQSVQAWLTVRRNRSRAHVELLTIAANSFYEFASLANINREHHYCFALPLNIYKATAIDVTRVECDQIPCLNKHCGVVTVYFDSGDGRSVHAETLTMH